MNDPTQHPYYCPYCTDNIGNHYQLTIGDHQTFGDYTEAYCPACSETFEITQTRLEWTNN